jgi:pyruvate dehydrogenase E2 component (dihydrolipoamide acetyltransferase)
VESFTPIINPPQAGILGVGKIMEKPVVLHGGIHVRSMMTLSLVFDHRLIDGAPAARFLAKVKELLEQPAWIG